MSKFSAKFMAILHFYSRATFYLIFENSSPKGFSLQNMKKLVISVFKIKYLLLTEFEGRTVSYGPSFFLLDLWPTREARGP